MCCCDVLCCRWTQLCLRLWAVTAEAFRLGNSRVHCYVLAWRVVESVEQRCVCVHGLWQSCQLLIFPLKCILVVMSRFLLLYLLYFLWFCLSLFVRWLFFHVCLQPCRKYSDVDTYSSLAVVLAVFVFVFFFVLVIVFMFLTHLLLVCCCFCHLLDAIIVLLCRVGHFINLICWPSFLFDPHPPYFHYAVWQ